MPIIGRTEHLNRILSELEAKEEPLAADEFSAYDLMAKASRYTLSGLRSRLKDQERRGELTSRLVLRPDGKRTRYYRLAR